MKHEKAIVQTPDGPMQLHLCFPDSKESVPVILVFQEAFGVNENILQICERFANAGYLAIAPELFHRVGSDTVIPYSDMPKAISTLGSLQNQDLIDDIESTLDYVESIQGITTGCVGAIGFCMGGFTAMLGACRFSLDYAISCYGGGISNERPNFGLKPFLDEFKNIECPVFLLYGEKDQSITQEHIEQVRGALKRVDKEYEIKVYLGAGHAFLREGEAPFHATAAAEAWKDIFSWLDSQR